MDSRVDKHLAKIFPFSSQGPRESQLKIVFPLKISQIGILQFVIYNFFETGCVLNDYIPDPLESFILPLCVCLQVKVLLFQQIILSSQVFKSIL